MDQEMGLIIIAPLPAPNQTNFKSCIAQLQSGETGI